MSRAKNGTRMAYISVLNSEVDSTWITNHYDGLLQTYEQEIINLTTEADVTLETESSVTLTITTPKIDVELTTISFVGGSNPTPNASAGFFKAS